MVIDVLTLILQQCQFEPGFDTYIKMKGLYKRLRGSLSIRASLGERGKKILEGRGTGRGERLTEHLRATGLKFVRCRVDVTRVADRIKPRLVTFSKQ